MDYNNLNEEVPFTLDDFLDEKARKKRIKEERKRRKSYKFSDKEHSKRGILSSVFALFAVLIVICAIILSAVYKGQGSVLVGVLTAFGFVASIAGFIVGALSFKETDSIMRFSWIGVIANGALFLALAILMISGM